MNFMKVSALTFCVFFVLSFFPALAQEKPVFKVLTYNIYHGENPEISDSSNLAQLAKLIIQLQPEVIALQEVDSMTTRSERVNGEKVNIVEYLSNATGYQGNFTKAMDYAEGSYGEGILVKKGSEYKTQHLPNPAGGEPRAMAWVKLELKNQEELYFGATHLCHELAENRIAQVAAITTYADSLKGAVLWAGDLNFAPDS
jgi:endonuclease/exonuclease/phosphatase family metal-dependent hydrolase